jgi:hypothetical protein
VGPQPSPRGVGPHDALHALEGHSLNLTHVASSPAQHNPALSIPGSAEEKLSLTEEGLLRLIGGGRGGAVMGAGDGGAAGGRRRRECGKELYVPAEEQGMNPRWWNAKTVALLQGAIHCWRRLLFCHLNCRRHPEMPLSSSVCLVAGRLFRLKH